MVELVHGLHHMSPGVTKESCRVVVHELGLHRRSPEVVELVMELHHRNPRVVKLEVGQHHEHSENGHEVSRGGGASVGASPWEP